MQEDDEDAWRLIQVFLSGLRVPFVEVCHNRESGEVRCNCPSGQRKRSCRHRELVLARIRLHGGRYPMLVRSNAQDAFDDPDMSAATHRSLVLRFGRVEVL